MSIGNSEAVLLGYQCKWVLDRGPRKCSIKSRQVGITWATAYEAVEVASSARAAGGSNFWYQTYAEEDAKEFIVDCAFWAEQFNITFREYTTIYKGSEAQEHFILPDGVKSVKVTSILFRSSYKIVALPHSPRKLRGKRGVYCLDEAAQHDDFNGILKACGAFEVWRGRIIIISTVTDEENEWWQYMLKVKAGLIPGATLHITTIFDALKDGLFKRICYLNNEEWSQIAEDGYLSQLLSREGSDQEFKCIPAQVGKKYLPKVLITPCLYDAPVYRFYRSSTWFKDTSEKARKEEICDWFRSEVDVSDLKPFPHYLGVDFGRSSDRSIFVPGYTDGKLDLWVPFVIELGNIPFENQKHLCELLIDSLPLFSFSAFDSTGNGQFLAEWALGHWGEDLIECVFITDIFYHAQFPILKSRYQERTFHHPKDLDHVLDLSFVEVINGKPFIPRKRIKAQREDAGKELRHAEFAVGGLMLSYASNRDPMTYGGYEAVKSNTGMFSRKGAL